MRYDPEVRERAVTRYREDVAFAKQMYRADLEDAYHSSTKYAGMMDAWRAFGKRLRLASLRYEAGLLTAERVASRAAA